MLCQLVCVDRRYRRMNYFNIREIQGILKQKPPTNLVNTSGNRSAMDSTLVGIRHKNNMSNILLYGQFLFYNFSLVNTPKYKYSTYYFCLSKGHSPYIWPVTPSIQVTTISQIIKQVIWALAFLIYLYTSNLHVVNECCGWCCCFGNNPNTTPDPDPYKLNQNHSNILSIREFSLDKSIPESLTSKSPSPVKDLSKDLITTVLPPSITEVITDPSNMDIGKEASDGYDSQQSFRAYNPSDDCKSSFLRQRDYQIHKNEGERQGQINFGHVDRNKIFKY